MTVSDQVTALRDDVDELKNKHAWWSYLTTTLPAILILLLAGVALIHLAGIGKDIALGTATEASATIPGGEAGGTSADDEKLGKGTTITEATGKGQVNTMTVSEFNNRWVVVVTALVASVAPLIVISGKIGIGGAEVATLPPRETSSTRGSTRGADSGRDSTEASAAPADESQTGSEPQSQAGSLSFSREPTLYTTVAIAILDAAILFGLPEGATPTEKTAIIGGLTALAGLFIRSRVSPVKPKKYVRVASESTSG